MLLSEEPAKLLIHLGMYHKRRRAPGNPLGGLGAKARIYNHLSLIPAEL